MKRKSAKVKMATVKMIDVGRINILNPRTRNRQVFAAMTGNIRQVGLKKPITVRRARGASGKGYDLVCGQGRLEAFIACGQKQIPALVIEASEEQALIMSLVENCARRQHRTQDLLQAVEILKRQGYSTGQIALKIGMTKDYITDILRLMEHGEERLVTAVELGQIPLTVANKIAASSDADMQRALRELYETRQLRGNRLLQAQRLVEARRLKGKSYGRTGTRGPGKKRTSSDNILRAYRRDAERKRMDTRKAEAVSGHLLFVTAALKQLFREGHFTTLLRAEGIVTMPKGLSALVKKGVARA